MTNYKNIKKAALSQNCKYWNNFRTRAIELSSIEDLKKDSRLQEFAPKKFEMLDLEKIKESILKKIDNRSKRALQKKYAKIDEVAKAPYFQRITISVEYKMSRVWGSNPYVQVELVDENGNFEIVKDSASGCGYDKTSAAIAGALNKSLSAIKPFYDIMEKEKNLSKKANEVIEYGMGYDFIPCFEGGCGVNCFRAIFEKVGFKFSQIASGKMFTVYTIEKM